MGRRLRVKPWPKTFHRIWLSDPERPEFLAWRDKLAALHPDWTIRTWQDPDELKWMRHYDLMRSLLETDPYGRAPDLLRYELLFRFGGTYIDTDFEPLRGFDELYVDPRPFAAWESDRTMCTALLAAPPEHPAIGVLLDGVVERLKATEGKPANEAIGPEYATALWRERDDVRRLPPWTFYPVCWYERNLLGRVEYPERTYAVHHWAKGWDPAKPKKPAEVLATPSPSKGNVPISFLVAFRDADGARTRLWDFIRERTEIEFPDAEIIVGTDDGDDPFHKTLALNRAAREATSDIFVIWDADTWLSPDAIRAAAKQVNEAPHRWVKPWQRKIKLNAAATEHVLSLGLEWDGTLNHRPFGSPEHSNTFWAGPPIVLHRSAWETVGGHDERFRGWGSEDESFAFALQRLVGQPISGQRATAYHLHHPRIGRSGRDAWPGQDLAQRNQELANRYRRARSPAAMRALVDEQRLEVVG